MALDLLESLTQDTVEVRHSLESVASELEFIGKYLRSELLSRELAEAITSREVWRLYGEVTNLMLAVTDKLEEWEKDTDE